MSRDFLATEPYGKNGKVGLINVGPNPVPVIEFYRMIPSGVLVNESKIHEGPQIAEEAEELGKRAIEAAKLLAEGKPDVIAFTCTASAMSVGPEADYEQIKDMEAVSEGIPCTTTTTGAFNAFKFMGWKKICLAGPYTQQIMDRFIGVLKARGYEVLSSKTLGLKYLDELKNTPVQKAYDIAMESFTPGTDGIFIPCTTFRSIDVIEKIEKETGVPVITSNQASIWECLRIIGNDELVEGYGKLLRIPNRSLFKGLPR